MIDMWGLNKVARKGGRISREKKKSRLPGGGVWVKKKRNEEGEKNKKKTAFRWVGTVGGGNRRKKGIRWEKTKDRSSRKRNIIRKALKRPGQSQLSRGHVVLQI